MSRLIKSVAKGVLSFIPGATSFLPKQATGGTSSARYCYEVWLKHLTMLWAHGMSTIPRTVAELGPGDSIGTGLAAMLSGTDRYYALDVVKFANRDFNLKIFDELVKLFRARAAGPANGWPDYKSYLDENRFPSHILTNEVLEQSLAEDRVRLIRNAIENPGSSNNGIAIHYMVPWSDDSVIEKESVDVIISHSVLELVADLEGTYRSLHSWLKVGGIMTHQLNLTSLGLSKKWNGHRAYPEIVWKLIAGRGGRYLIINRQPYSTHRNLIEKTGFKIICNLQAYRSDKGIKRSQLAKRWKNISDDDLACSSAFIQARKQAVPPP